MKALLLAFSFIVMSSVSFAASTSDKRSVDLFLRRIVTMSVQASENLNPRMEGQDYKTFCFYVNEIHNELYLFSDGKRQYTQIAQENFFQVLNYLLAFKPAVAELRARACVTKKLTFDQAKKQIETIREGMTAIY